MFTNLILFVLATSPVLTLVGSNLNSCRRDQFKCRDGSCISFDGKCDGIVDCPDRSDETHALCRNMQCQSNLFRCTYGACVDGTAPCNGKQECADNSDESLPKCRNEISDERGQFKCSDGGRIPSESRCDGLPHCQDGSDETIRACAAFSCPSNLFKCAYGACVDRGADCNDVQECADGSDESEELCNRTTTFINTEPPTDKPPKDGSCVLPPLPEHGSYTSSIPNGSPGQTFDSLYVNVSCNQGYGLTGGLKPTLWRTIHCIAGVWSEPGWWQGAICIRTCQLKPHQSVVYRCQVPEVIAGFRICNEYEPSGTVVKPACNTPDYYTPITLRNMKCRNDGTWDHVAKCSPECGTVPPKATELVIGGWSAKSGEVSWHAAIYTRASGSYKQICGGSIISNTMVISAAHCFWNNAENQRRPLTNYAVAVGNLYRSWNDPLDNAQTSDVLDVHIPVHYRGLAAHYQSDIAVVTLVIPIVYRPDVRPVCVSFDQDFERRQLKPGRLGKVAGWGLTGENGDPSQVLKAVELPYVDTTSCIEQSPPSFTQYITTDKICAGFTNGTALCQGDSGGGLAFPESERGVQRYYLRGIVSTAPGNINDCNAYAYTSFTQLLRHEDFVNQFWTEA